MHFIDGVMDHKQYINILKTNLHTSAEKMGIGQDFDPSSSECSAQGQVLHYKHRNLGCSFAEGRSSIANSGTKAAVLLGINRYGSFLHPSFSLASAQTLKDSRDTVWK